MGKRGNGRTGAVLVGAGISLLTFFLYLRTLAPTVLPFDLPDLADSGMLQMQACVLGISHPTGYPTYLMLSHLLTYLPFGDCAYRVNLASAVYAALAVSAVYVAGLLLSRRVVAAAAGALAFGVGTTFWSQAVIAEVYTLNALLVALTLIALLLWRDRRRDGYLVLSAFLGGLAITNHMTSALLVPAAFLFVAVVDWRKLVEAKLVLKGVGAFLLGLTPYLYLPIRASMDPPFLANNPTNFERFWYVVSGGNLTGGFFAFGPAELPRRLSLYGEHLMGNFNWWLLVASAVGLVALLLWDRAVAALTGFLFLGWMFYSIENNIVDVKFYFIPTYLIIALWISGGLGVLLEEAESLVGGFRRASKTAVLVVLSAALLFLPLPGIGDAYAQNDKSKDHWGRQVLEDVAKKAKPNATILHHRTPLWYMVLVEKRRQDLTLLDPFRHNKEIGYADIVWPADGNLANLDRRYGTNDLTGVTSAKMAAKRGPVYILAQADIDYRPLWKAGFRAVQVKGALYELIPPGGRPHHAPSNASP